MRKLHPASVPVRSLSRSLNVGFLFFVVGVVASPGGGVANLLSIGAMVLVGIAVGVAYEYAYYRRFRYELTRDTFDVTSGVLSRRDREVPLRRVQNVDVRQNVLQRALGIAAVHVETAGGGETEVTLRFVSEGEAKRLQRQLRGGAGEEVALDRAAGSGVDAARPDRGERPTGVGGQTGDGPVGGTAGARRSATGRERDRTELLFEIRPTELAILSVFTIDPGASLLATVALSFASGLDPSAFVPIGALRGGLPGSGLVLLAWVVLVFLAVAWVLSAALTFNRYYGFRLVRVGDELHYERGLLQRYSGSIPLDKVQTLTVKESVPFRWFGYASLAVETAGYAPGQSDSRGTESAIPLAQRGRVSALARSIEPFAEGPLRDIPGRARERYAVRYVGVVGLVLVASYLVARFTALFDRWYAPVALLVAVPVAAHLKWRSRGYRDGERYFLARTGFWRRTTKVVPYYRVQAVIDTRTIFQRRRRLASVTADTASSASFFGRAATAIDVDGERAAHLAGTIEGRLQEQLRERRDRRVFDAAGSEADDRPGGDDRGGDGDVERPGVRESEDLDGAEANEPDDADSIDGERDDATDPDGDGPLDSDGDGPTDADRD